MQPSKGQLAFSPVPGDTRVALADVSGHGSEVDGVTQTLHKLMHNNINTWDQSDFMRGVNDAFRQGGDHKYATAIVLSFHRVMGRLAFSNAGHLPPLWYHAAQRAWGWLEEGTEAKKVSGLPVGLIPGTEYRDRRHAPPRSSRCR
jgi:serine phosphatase RsbU (regulator of sigma subunit)